MSKLLKQESVNDNIHLKFGGFSSICRYDKQRDTGTIELTYVPGPGKRLIDSKKLIQYLNSFEKREIAMENIPIEILKFCIEQCLSQRPPTRYASPDEIEVTAIFGGEGKDWGMTPSVKFSRRIT